MFNAIGQFIVSSSLVIAAFFGYHQNLTGGAAATVYVPAPRYESSLALALTATQTSTMSLVSGVDGNGMTLSGPMCFTLDSGVANSVEDLCGIAAGKTVTNLIRGVDTSGVTASSTLAHAHRVGADVKITDSPYLAQYYRLLNGIDSFPNPLQLSASNTPASLTGNTQNLATVAYVNQVATSGAPAASYTTPGIGLLATTTQLQHGLDGSPTHYFVTSNFVNASSGPNTIPFTNPSGVLDPSFLAGGTYSVAALTAASETFSNATSGVIVTGASGSASAVQPGASGNLLQSNGSSWVSAASLSPQRFISPNFATTTVGGTVTSTIASATVSAAATSTVYVVSFYVSDNGGTNVTTTFQIGNVNLFSCLGYQTGGGGMFTISMDASTSKEVFSGYGFSGCTATNGTLPETLNLSATSTWKIFGSTSGVSTLNGALYIYEY